jgi:hypothetical protein
MPCETRPDPVVPHVDRVALQLQRLGKCAHELRNVVKGVLKCFESGQSLC